MSTCVAAVYRRPQAPPEACGMPAKGERHMVGSGSQPGSKSPACGVHLRSKRDPFLHDA